MKAVDPGPRAPDLVFEGLVLSIENAPVGLGGAYLDWVVRMRVEDVLSGRFDGDAFSFRVHSPARSGLRVGERCTVTATRTGIGYAVDENQWRGSPHSG